MAKTVILEVPDDLDIMKFAPIINAGASLRVLKADEIATVHSTLGKANRGNGIKRVGRKRDQSVISTIMGHYAAQGIFTATHAQAWVHQKGYNMHSASPALTALKKSGHIAQVDTGRFKFVRPLAPGQTAPNTPAKGR